MSHLRARPQKTLDDYMRLPDEVRAELIAGELYASPSPKVRHQQIVSNLHFLLRSFVDSHDLGLVFHLPLDVYLPSGDIVQPDVVFVSSRNRHICQDWIRGVPDLVIEVVSPETPERDRLVKRDLYGRNGVVEYWLVDDADKSVEVLRLAGTVFEPLGYFEGTDAVQSAILPDLLLPVRDVFA
jgi:Uma2 family endonuclease